MSPVSPGAAQAAGSGRLRSDRPGAATLAAHGAQRPGWPRRSHRRRQAGRNDVARRGRPDSATGSDPARRSRRHARSDGDRRLGDRGRTRHPTAQSPCADGQKLRRHDPAGSATTTDDAEGELLAEARCVPGSTSAAIRSGVAALTGEILQRPSSVSAIKVDGRRAYDRVRAGETVELAARPVTVSRFAVVGRTPTPLGRCLDLDVEVDCSSGTYVRALARDLGQALGVGGHLTRLRRTRVGPFRTGPSADPGRAGRAGRPDHAAAAERHRGGDADPPA